MTTRHKSVGRQGEGEESGVRLRRTVLFFPASAPSRYPKAVATGADAVCIDLEDAVAPDAKDQAREAAMRLIASRGCNMLQARQNNICATS